jgi:DNA-binding CsgD family transcriptional regulator
MGDAGIALVQNRPMSRSSRRTDVLDVVDACYRMDLDEETWLRGLLEVVGPLIDQGMFNGAYLFDASDPAGLKMLRAHFSAGVDMAQLGAFLGGVPYEYVRKSWLRSQFGYAASIPGFDGLIAEGLAAFGARDVCAICGIDPSGRGVWVGSILSKRGRATDAKAARFGRVAAHLATSYRYRRRLAAMPSTAERPEAVLAPDGRVEHAEGVARTKEARADLRRAVVAMDKARSAAGHADPDSAIASWKGLVSARWTLVDRFDADGRRFLVAAENRAVVPVNRKLSSREQEILAYAAIGRDNKEIAYELGLSQSTVRVLMARAAKKLGARTRVEALAKLAETEAAH